MKTIEERGEERYPGNCYNIIAQKEAYIDGATEQKAIDIERVKEWIANTFPSSVFNTAEMQDDFVKFMEEE